LLLQLFHGIRSERQMMERLDFDLLFCWFVGLVSTIRCGTLRYARPQLRASAQQNRHRRTAWHGTVRNSVCGRAVEHYAAMALMKRSPKMTAN
jgi:hypothetical protein